VAGIGLRVVVFLFQQPFNNDSHADVIAYFINTGRLPTIPGISQAYHPPLYYLVAVPWIVLAGWKGVQAFSLALSIANLYVLYRLVRDTLLIAPHAIRVLCLLVAALLPPFVLFGNYISNDALAFLLGSLIVFQAHGYLRAPSVGSVRDLALLLGLGLLTKITFLAYAPCLVALVLVAERRRRAWGAAVMVALGLGVLGGTVGSYKFVENAVRFGRPVVTSLDLMPPGLMQQQRAYPGPRAFVDVNLLTLLRNPVLTDATRQAYPLLLYATLWYPHIPESNLRSPGADRVLAPVIYGLAIVPTVALGVGLCRLVAGSRRLRAFRTLPTPEFRSAALSLLCVALLLTNLGLVIAAGLRHHVWSVFQARLLFPALFPLLLVLGAGLQPVWRFPAGRVVVAISLSLLFATFLAYYIAVIAALWS
jgi:hypothetical protein